MVGKYPTDSTCIRGGVQAATFYLVKGLSRIDGLELHILTFRPSGWAGPDRVDQNGVCVHLMPPYPRFERLRSYRTYQNIFNERLAQIQPDIVHAQGAASDALVALRSGYPTIVTVHGIRREDQKYYGTRRERLRCFFDSALTEREVIGRTRYLIAISHYVTQYFAARFRPEFQCFYIPNAIDQQFFDLVTTSSQPIVLYVGSVIPRKRLTDLIMAFGRVIQLIPSAQLHIAGEVVTEPAYVDKVRRLIREKNLEEHVQLLGALSETEVFREFTNCSILVLPSSQETTPMVIGQAMAAGKPVLATPVGGVPEMLGEHGERGLLVPIGHVEELARSIIDLLQDAKLRERIGSAGRRFAQEYYHPSQVAMRTAEVYREVVTKEMAVNG